MRLVPTQVSNPATITLTTTRKSRARTRIAPDSSPARGPAALRSERQADAYTLARLPQQASPQLRARGRTGIRKPLVLPEVKFAVETGRPDVRHICAGRVPGFAGRDPGVPGSTATGIAHLERERVGSGIPGDGRTREGNGAADVVTARVHCAKVPSAAAGRPRSGRREGVRVAASAIYERIVALVNVWVPVPVDVEQMVDGVSGPLKVTVAVSLETTCPPPAVRTTAVGAVCVGVACCS